MKIADLAPCFDYPHMTVRQLMVLLLIEKENSLKLREVSAALRMPRPSVSRAFDGLINMKFIRRQRGEDRRDVSGVITDKGREFAHRLTA